MIFFVKIIKKTYKYKLKTNSTQEKKLISWINTCRAVYNVALENKIYVYSSRKISLTKYDLINQLPELKKEFDWIKDVPAQTLQAVIERMDVAYQSFFRGGGFPKFAKRDRYRSILIKQGISITNKHIKLPKIGSIRYFNSKNIPEEAKIKQAVIKKEVDGFYISLSVEQLKPISLSKSDSQAVGIDMGVAHFATTSNGTHIANPKTLKQYESQLRIAHRSLARKNKGSNNRKKAKKSLAKVYLKISRIRSDFLHKNSTLIVELFQTIAVEDLKLKNMTKSAKGTAENHGKNVKAKSGLNKSLLDVSIGEFFLQLEYKADWYGRQLIKVNPKHTSTTCHKCGLKAKENRKSQSEFYCFSCGHSENADVNASKNILARALANVPKRKAVA